MLAGDSKVETTKQSFYQVTEDMRVESKSKLLIQPNNMRSSDVGIKVIEKRNVNHTALASGDGRPESSLGATVIGGRSSV